MEMLMLLALALAVYFVWLKPQKENLAFACFLFGTAICCVMYLIGVSAFFVPMGNI